MENILGEGVKIMRRHRSRRRKKQNKLIILSTICLLFVMTAGYAAFQTNLNITAKGNILEKSRVIQSWTSTSNEDFHTDYYRENIVTATFLDDARVPSDAVESWDVSVDKDKGVMAWVVPNQDDGTKYDLYIGANKGVIANEDSSYLFYKFKELNSITFENNFDTSNVVNMQSMFAYCQNIASLDLNNFNTSNVENMRALFYLCSSLNSLDLQMFDTRNVTTMALMFEHCYNLKIVNLISFNTSKVIDMDCMFHNCYKLEQLNLCSFDTSNVKDMKWMFQRTDILTNIYVGENWSTSLAESTFSVVNGVTTTNVARMFDGSGVSSVTTGQC